MRSSLMLSCWPGLTQLWWGGSWFGLLLASAFSVMLNATLLATFVWPGQRSPAMLLAAWLLIGCVWTWGFGRSWRRLRGFRPSESDDGSDQAERLYLEAQGEYLQGHWLEAESLLHRLLKGSPEDVEARLMLATLYRHTEQIEDANRQLRSLARLESGRRWELEIRRERELRQGMIAEESRAEEAEESRTEENESLLPDAEAA